MNISQTAPESLAEIKPTKFADVTIGGWFKEREGGAWHLKTSRSTALYRANGVKAEPVFAENDTVYIPA